MLLKIFIPFFFLRASNIRPAYLDVSDDNHNIASSGLVFFEINTSKENLLMTFLLN